MGAVSRPGLSTYIPKPDEFTRRNKVLQAGAALGVFLGGGLLLRSMLKGGCSKALSGKALVVSTLVSAVALWALRKIDSPYSCWLEAGDITWQATLLHYANYHSSKWLVRFLFMLGANPNTKDVLGYTSLHYKTTTIPMMKYAIERGADVNAEGYKGRTPLHFHYNDIERAELLIKHGADPYLQGDNGVAPVDLAYKMKLEVQAKGIDAAILQQDKIMRLLYG